jgi:hypothetical protein
VTTTPIAIPIMLSRDRDLVSSTRLEVLAVRLAQFLLAAWLLFSFVQALKAAFWFDGYPVNGPFQMYDPLRRIAAGQRAGQDFVFFHGIGVPFLHYPLFWLFGGQSLVASELSRQFTSLALFSLTLWAFVRVTFRHAAARWIGSATVVLALEAMFRHGAAPGHSLVSGRSALPILAFAVLQLRVSQTVKALLTGGCIACGFLFGTEHGISLSLALLAIAAFSAVQSFLAQPRSWQVLLANIRFVAIAFTTAGVSAPALLWAFCGFEGAVKALHYNLVELPTDQFWFFGSPPMPYLYNWRQLIFDHHVILCFFPTCLILVLLLFLLVRTFRTPIRLDSDWRALAAVMLVYAALTAIPLIGILSKHYIYPQARVVSLLALLVIAQLSRSRHKAFLKLPRLAAAGLCAVCLLAGGAMVIQASVLGVQTFRHWRSDPASFDRTLDAHWNNFMTGATNAIEEHRTRAGTSLWSEYAALLDAHYGTFQPAEDYIIHAVGPIRWHHYIDTFRATNPEFVTTMNSQFSFAEWLQDERWEFYEELLNNYRPIAEVEHALIWQRRAGPWVYPSQTFQPLTLNRGAAESVTLPVSRSEEQIVVVRVRYRVSNPWRKLPLFGATPRYLATIEGTARNTSVSLPPYLNTFQFPVKLPIGQPVTIRFRIDSVLPDTAIEVEEVKWKPLSAQPGLCQMFTPRLIPSRY